MATFVSSLPHNCPILGDNATAYDADRLFTTPPLSTLTYKGRERRDYSAVPFGAVPFCTPFPDAWRIPRREWPDLIEYKQKQKARMADLVIRSQPYLGSLNQGSTNYCWGNAVVTCLEILRELNGLPYIKLSSASVCAPIKNFRNNGGWGEEALAYIIEHGIAPASLWPANAIDRSYDNERTRLARQAFKISEFWDLPPYDFEALASALLHGKPCAIGLDWWGHEVAALDLVMVDGGGFGVLCRNSWGDSYGDGRGLFVLTERKAIPDDCSAPAVTTGTPAVTTGTPALAA